MTQRRLSILVAALLIGGGGSALARQQQPPDSRSLGGLRWREIGPYRGGRVEAVTGIPGDPYVFYFGAVAGGVWKTTDGGLNWQPLFQHEPVASIGAIALAPSDRNILYVGTGEACLRNDITYGDGVYRSLDGGRTWTHLGLDDTRHIARVIVDPRDPNLVLVAAVGHAFGPNTERGVFRTTDGGRTWQKVLYKDENTGAADLVADPANPHILYAALYQERREPWTFTSGGPGSGIYKSTDEGLTWTQLAGHGLPVGAIGHVALAAGADGERVYALIEAEKGGLYVSNNAGESWALVNDEHRLWQRAWYFIHIFADPRRTDTLWVLNFSVFRSEDGGRSFDPIVAPHGDNHDLWIDPSDSSRAILGNDGGATITADYGRTWTTQDNQPTAEFYHVIVDNRFFYRVYGAQQDNSTVSIASRTDHGAIDRTDWYAVGGGESGYIAPDPADNDVVYAAGYGGTVTRMDVRTGQAQLVSPWPQFTDGRYAAQMKHRFNWTAPLVASLHEPHAVYFGGEELFKTTDGGMTWTAISPDLTRNDKSKQQSSGGPISKDDASTEYYDTIFTVAESSAVKDQIWVGTDDGLIWLTRDGGKNWKNVTPKDIPEWSCISLIDASAHDPGTAYAAVDRHKLDDLAPYAYKTTDFGRTWTKITAGIPSGSFLHVVREDPARRGLLFAGTETGVFVSFDDGANWQSLQLNLPTVPVHDLAIKGDDLVAATHGRSFWILDDISPLRQWQAAGATAPVHLFKPAAAYRVLGAGGFGGGGGAVGANPPSGAVLYYSLSSVPQSEITLQILDRAGNVVRSYSNHPKPVIPPLEPERPVGQLAVALPARAGLNRFVWDLHYAPPEGVPGAVYMEGGQLSGPVAVPGEYTVRLEAGGQTVTAPLLVKGDPRTKASAEALAKQLELALKIRDRITEVHHTVNLIRGLDAQLKMIDQRVGGDARNQPILDAADQLDRKAIAVESELFQIKKRSVKDSFNYGGRLNDMYIALEGYVDRTDDAPTAQDYEVLAYLDSQLQPQLDKWRAIVTGDLPAFNRLLDQGHIGPVGLPSAESTPRQGH
ncbi:MAG TPA: hypothetical protein VGS20_11040 [Candidatus Acidoferrales bacterium]|nr:hypothetical protein [Candidatus Acidoferrales bacterium]